MLGRVMGTRWAIALVASIAFGCSADSSAPPAADDDGASSTDVTIPAGGDEQPAGDPAGSGTEQPTSGEDPGMPADSSADPSTPDDSQSSSDEPAGDDVDEPGGTDTGAAGASGSDPDPSTPSDGPVDGDPSAPMVSVDGVPCGAPQLSFINVPQEHLVDIGGREVFVAYPCANEGAQVTFFLFIHGTLQEGQKIPFTMTAFPIHTKVDSDNFIVVTPQAVGSQWGNGDNGEDLPHLYDVIDWVYETFGDKFDIRSMWASGGSWGAFYLSTFACDPMLEGRLDGVRMVVGGGCPRCSDGLACIVAQQELELGGGSPLSDAEKEMRIERANIERYANMHGCDAREGPMTLGSVRAWTWPNCDQGYAHSYYLGAGQHADRWDDPEALDYMTAELKSIEQ